MVASPDKAASRTEERSWQSCSFGPFEYFPERHLLLKDGSQVRVGPRALDLLKSLVHKAGEVVSKNELISQVWKDFPVDEAALKVNMSALRRALGEGSDSAEYIASVMGRGFRFISPVRFGNDHVPPSVPTAVAHETRHNLSTGTTRILGRADAIDSISQDLAKSRLVSIVGPGGVGKTTVAIAIAERFIGKCRDGVWVVDLATIKDPAMLPSAIAIALGGSGQLTTSEEALTELLRGQELLLVLDNCEHLVDAVAACVNRILSAVSDAKLLVTTREALMLSGERVRRLPALAIPPISSTLAAQQALKFSAVQLFAERAAESHESFELTDADAPVVADICRKLDGLALAIELAASRVDAFGVSGLQKQLQESRLPTSDARSGPERHRTLAATIEWSYGLLSVGEAQVLRAVSTFAGTFNAEGAAAVADLSTIDATKCLMQLSAKSLLSIDFDEDKIAYRLLETTRAFCLHLLRRDSSHGVIVQRHARYVFELLNQTTSEWVKRPNQKLAANYDRALDELYKAICTSTMVSQALLFQAMDALRSAAEIAGDLRDVDSQLRSLRILGVYELFTGEPRSAWHTFEKLAAVTSLYDPTAVDECETLLAVAELLLGRLESSRSRLDKQYAENLRQITTVRNRKQTMGDSTWVIPHPRWLTGSPDTAAQLAQAAIDAVTQVGDKTVLINNVLAYAVPVFYWCGHTETCRGYALALQTHSETYGFFPRRPIARIYRAALDCRESRDVEENIRIMQDSLEELRVTNHLARMPYHLCLLAEALTAQGRLEEADLVINSSIDSIRAQGEEWCLPEVLRVRAAIFSARHDEDGAEASLQIAMQKARGIGALSWELRAANDLATVWIRQGRLADARAMLEPILGQFSEGYGTRDLQTAAELLRQSGEVADPPDVCAGQKSRP